jgi:SWI/SNF-related matrix-associated actin-dependent regulator 1 of chromatin subfamily A
MEEKLKPYPYQEEGIEKILALKRCINGDEMGLGKTAQSIVAVERARATPCLVVCPAALKVNWEREVRRFTHLRPLILTDANKATFPYFIGTMDMYDVCIVNFESLKKFFVVHAVKPYRLKDIVFQNVIKQFKSVIIDESARCKDPGTLQTRLCMGICSGKEYVVELTGTPIINDPKDIATQICILGKIGEFGGYKEFMLRYGDGKHLRELHNEIHEKCYFRRSKKLVLKDLPDLTRTKVVTPLSNQSEYDTCERDLKSWLVEYKKLSEGEAKRKMRKEALVRFMNLRKLAGQGKVDAAIQFIEDTTEPVVVFVEHHDVVDALCEAIPDAVCVTGRQDQKQKQYAIDAFQEGKRRVIVCSIKAAGVGLTLTASSNVVFVNLPWHMADLSQCEARCWRNGQKNAVNSWVLIGEKTIDEYLFNLIMNKGSVASKITGAGDDALKDEKYFEELADALLSPLPAGATDERPEADASGTVTQ